MKNITFKLLITLFVIIALGCKKDDDKTPLEEIGIIGRWQLDKILVNSEEANYECCEYFEFIEDEVLTDSLGIYTYNGVNIDGEGTFEIVDTLLLMNSNGSEITFGYRINGNEFVRTNVDVFDDTIETHWLRVDD